MLDIMNAVAVITGGASGLGLALAEYWVRNGGRVVLGDVNGEALEKAAKTFGAQATTVVCNVTMESDCQRLAETAMERFGAINMVAPFAGIIRDGLMVAMDKESGKVTGKMSLEQFQSVINVNLTGVFLTVRECVEQMANNGCKGLICLVSSIGALGTAGQINYSSSKAAVAIMPKVITSELFRRGVSNRIRCAAIAPGYVKTPMVESMNQAALNKILETVPLGRLIEPEEVASLAGEIYRNEALSSEVFYIHGGLRLGSRG